VIGWLCRLGDAARDRARERRWNAEQRLGRRGEDLAHRYLETKGLTVVARNYRPPSGGGEIDLVARDGEKLVFVEVKSRMSGEFGAPERNVGQEKRAALLRAARAYARRAGAPWEMVRFDIVSVLFSNPPAIDHFPDAIAPARKL
jgi:putative endonuclease